jgi:hypothetical protein
MIFNSPRGIMGGAIAPNGSPWALAGKRPSRLPAGPGPASGGTPNEKGAPLTRDALEVFRRTGTYSFLEASSKMSPRFVRSEAPEDLANWS